MGSAWSFRRELLLSMAIPVLSGLGDSPSSWAPPLGEGVVSGLTVAPCSLLIDELGVTAPRVVGDAVVVGSPLQSRVDLAMPPLGQVKLLLRATYSGFEPRSKQLPHPQWQALLRTEGTFS